MENRQLLEEELHKMQVVYTGLDLLQDKDGVTVARVHGKGSTYVLKYFSNPEYRREIGYYQLLSRLGIPVLKVIQATGTAYLMEDVATSSVYRLGTAADLGDKRVAALIADWYRQLHRKGRRYVAENGEGLYDESDFFTLENIALIKAKTHTADLPVWRLLEENFKKIRKLLDGTQKTLTYNDFYYTNLAVSREGINAVPSALMFDYNLLGKGYAYADIRNVCSSLSGDAREAFLKAYGPFDRREAAVDDVVSVIVTLYFACRREAFPGWAAGTLDSLQTDYGEKVGRLLKETY